MIVESVTRILLHDLKLKEIALRRTGGKPLILHNDLHKVNERADWVLLTLN